jgi:anti-anti-sigma regulatory factor
MTFKIERVATQDGFVVFRVSGRIDSTYVAALQESMEKEKTTNGCRLAIDLSEVTLVSQEVVEALAVAEANGIELKNCPGYVREWVSRAKERHD